MRNVNGYYGLLHSAFVYNQDTLISKWGRGPLTKHHIDIYGYDTCIEYYTYYRKIVYTNNIAGTSSFHGNGTYNFCLNFTVSSCSWSVEPAAMFQTASGTGSVAQLSYATPFVYLAPKATITFTFSYGLDNHYSVSKEIDLFIPSTTVSGVAISDGFVLDANAVVTVTGRIKSNEGATSIVPVGTRLIIDGGEMTGNGDVVWKGIEVWGDKTTHQFEINGSYGQGYLELKTGP